MSELERRKWGVGEEAEWIADKVCALGDYGKDAARMLRKQVTELSTITAERDDLRFKLASECQHSKIFAEAYAGWKLRAESAEAERNALKARIEEAEPVARVQIVDGRVYVTSEPSMVSLKECGHDAPLYAIPPDPQELIRKAVEEERERFSKIDKAEFIGEFSFEISEVCAECVDTPDDDCPICQGTGDYQREVFVPWTTIKEIHKAMLNYAIRSRSTKEK